MNLCCWTVLGAIVPTFWFDYAGTSFSILVLSQLWWVGYPCIIHVVYLAWRIFREKKKITRTLKGLLITTKEVLFWNWQLITVQEKNHHKN